MIIGGVLVDAYVHVGLPRFQSVQDALAVMESSGIETPR